MKSLFGSYIQKSGCGLCVWEYSDRDNVVAVSNLTLRRVYIQYVNAESGPVSTRHS